MGLKEDLLGIIPEEKHNEIDGIIEKNKPKEIEKKVDKTKEVETIPIPPSPIKTVQEEQKTTKSWLQKLIDYL
jgi:hypothetical protein